MSASEAEPAVRRRRRLATAAILLLLGLGLFAVLDGPQLTLALATGSLEERGIDLRDHADELECAGDNGCRSGPLTAMTLNVLCRDCSSRHHDDWDERLPHLQAAVERHSPDLLALQELVGHEDVSDLLGEDSPYEIVVHEFGPWIYADAALLFRGDRFELLDSGQLWLGRSPRIPFGRAWTPISVPRYVNWALLREREQDFPLLFVTTHFDNNAENKIAAAALLAETLRPLAGNVPLVVAGDFNTDRGSNRYAMIRGTASGAILNNSADLAPLREQAGTDADLPEDGARRYLDPERLVDHVFVGGDAEARVTRWMLDAPVYGQRDRRPSDHPGIVTEFELLR